MILETIAALLGLAALGVGAELAARASLRTRDAWYVFQPYSRAEYRLDAKAVPTLPERVRFEANGDGERGDPVPADPAATLRVLVAGGSAAECFLLDQDDSWPLVVQRELNAREGVVRSAHVGNVARSLIPCRTIDPLLQRVLPHFRGVDAIVLMVGASDMVDWFEAKTPPSIDGANVDIARYCAEHPRGPFGWSPKTTALYRIARRLRVRLTRPVDRRENVGASRGKHRIMRANARTMLDETPDPAPMLEGFREHLTALVRTCRQHAQHVVIARQPWLDRVLTDEEERLLWNFGQGSPYRAELDTYYTIRLVRELMGRVDGVAAEVAAAEDVPAIDLRAEVPSDFEHYYDFLHHTPKGAAAVGRAVADCIGGLRIDEPGIEGGGVGRSAATRDDSRDS
ncbi:MAG: hypothetical protein AAGB93_09795 [Planctomycetota bacterium]